MAIINIAVIHNAASVVATIINHEKPSDTDGGKGVLAPGETRSLQMWVPWCHDGGDFDTKHIDVTVGKRTFKIWQAAQSDGDRVRASLDSWRNPGDPIGGFAAIGPVETVLGDVREAHSPSCRVHKKRTRPTWSPAWFDCCRLPSGRQLANPPAVTGPTL